MSDNKVTFLILNYNSRSLVRALVSDLQNYDKNLPICIVDNSHEVDLIRQDLSAYDHVSIVDSKNNLGYARGNNLGLKYIQNNNPTGYVCVCNPDIRIDSANFHSLMQIIKSGPIADIFGIRLVDDNDKELVSQWKQPTLFEDIINDSAILKFLVHRFKQNRIDKVPGDDARQLQNADVITGAFFVAKLETFSHVGFFDERTFLFCEERILAKRFDKEKIKRVIYNHITGRHSTSVTIKKKYNSKFRRHLLLVQARLVYYRHYKNKALMFFYFLSMMFSLVEKMVIDAILGLNKKW